MDQSFGIDLGTTYSCVGIFRNGGVEIIPNELGNRITPSVVAFTDEERLVGEAAKNQAALNPRRTVYSVKRLIGRKFNDKEVQMDKKLVSYEITNKDGKPYVEVEIKGQKKLYSPEDTVSAVEKATGKSEKIVVTNDSGRLSKEEIEKMLKEAKEFEEQDKLVKEKIDARNSLENYIYSMKNTVEDKEKGLGNKLSDTEKETITSAVKEAQDWLTANQEADKEDFETHLKDLQKVCDPIIGKIYKEAGGAQPGAEGGAEEQEEPEDTGL